MPTSALLLATTASADGGPAASLPFDGSTIVARLLEQLASLGAKDAWIVTRRTWRPAVEAAAGAADARATIVETDDVADDLRAVADVARRVDGRLVVADAHVVTHQEALARLLADPRAASAALAARRANGIREAAPLRAAGARIASAGSTFHRVADPDASFLGLLQVEPGDREPLAGAAGRLAELVEAWRADGSADEDASSLLLVGLVREGARVSLRELDGFFHAGPLSAAEAGEAEVAIRAYDEERIALDAAVKEKDGFFTTFFVSPYSKHLARFAAHRGWSPNALTTVALAMGVGAAACFATGQRIGLVAGAVLLQLAFVVDCVDGQLARYARRFSNLGAWLDSVFDRVKEYLVYAGLALGATRGFGDDVWALAAFAVAIQTVRHMVDLSFEARPRAPLATAARLPLDQPHDASTGHDQEATHGHEGSLPIRGTAVATGPPVTAARVDAPPAARPARAFAPSSLGRRAVAANEALERGAATRWGKRIFVLPIGERFALISLTAALASPRVTFVVLVAWSGVAALYALAARTATAVAE